MLLSCIKRLICVLLLLVLCLTGVQAQHKVNQKKIDKEKASKQKQADKDYRNAVKHHKQMQSKNTKAMMKQSRKESGSLTPVKR